MSLLVVENLHRSFGGIKAVDGASFRVETGSVTALIGPNGAGKTTAFNLVSGVLRADSGSIRLGGEELIGLRPHQITARGLSRTFQVTRGLSDLTVLENLVVAAPQRGWRSLFGARVAERDRSKAMELLEFVGIGHLADSVAQDLSYGQRKLLELAAALMPEPELILLDEPAGGVNPALLEKIVERISALASNGTTFLIVEHNMDLVMELSDSVIVMAHGSVLRQEAPSVVREDPVVLDAYLGRV